MCSGATTATVRIAPRTTPSSPTAARDGSACRPTDGLQSVPKQFQEKCVAVFPPELRKAHILVVDRARASRGPGSLAMPRGEGLCQFAHRMFLKTR
ncbi:hypothetical protein EN809_000015 [Mesorhizobium sp. M2E.F.Ca.ET.166.01.1.1]|nr:hypothetical protein EN862_009830 [Mesorhizobium sp. M2E.F.Ca.ET.219.01.1.1]TGT76049.1 hypothetical protein EN809_000015 [Mesorhizobium sp. M2E.F.Ca.ET.166.01.1.1]TGW02165.1 hypothetical protein EN797_000015 [Mesorhizobium sp. M2E.F.Ca.ET.154.01.1.1]